MDEYPKVIKVGGMTQVVQSAEDERVWTRSDPDATPNAPKSVPAGKLSPSLARKVTAKKQAVPKKGAKKR